MSTTAADWNRLKEIVADALDRPAGARTQFLRDACAGDTVLLEEASALVSDEADAVADTCMLHPRTDSFLGLGGPDPSAMAGQRFGKYELVELLGEGGMAAVYLARQAGMDRPVALKVLRPHSIAYDAQRRFGREVAAQGRIEHPSVAKIYDAGVVREGDLPGGRPVPYIAMEHVDGLPLTRFADVKNLSVADRLRLLADVADGVHAAHQRAIVHRDLKPANVLVEDDGQYGRPKVLDFGIARVLQSADEGTLDAGVADRARTLQTTAGVLLGTLGYMAPEQARGEGDRVDVRSDVYALGVMLHELLTGELPVKVANLPLTEALRRLSEPEVSAAQIRLPDGVRDAADLRAILSTALAAEPERRYPSAEALADDLRKLLRHEAISARLPTRAYLARKFARRHRWGVAAALALALALAGGATAATVGFVREAAARREADEQRRQAEAALLLAELETNRSTAARGFVEHILRSADVEEAGGDPDITLLAAIRQAEPELADYSGGDAVVESDIRTTLAQALRSLGEHADSDRQYDLALQAFDRREFEEKERLWAIELLLERAQSLTILGLAEKARAIDAEAVRRFETVGDAVDAHPNAPRIRWQIKSNRAGLLEAEGHYGESADLWVEVLAEAEGLIEQAEVPGQASAGITRDEFGSTQNNAANAMLAAGRSAEALALMERVVADYTQSKGQGHPRTLRARHNLANTLHDLGRIDEAEALARDVLALAEASLGPDHPTAVGARRGLANTLISRHSEASLNEALELVAASLASYERRGEADSLGYLLSVNNKGVALAALKRHAEALAAYEASVAVADEVLGKSHPMTLQLRANIAQNAYAAGDKEKGRREMETLLGRQIELEGADAQAVVYARTNLAMMQLGDGDARAAEANLRQALDTAEAGEWGGLIPLIRRNLGRALMAAGELDEAAAAFEVAYEEAAVLGRDQQRRAAAYLAEAHRRRGDEAEAAAWTERAGGAEIDLP